MAKVTVEVKTVTPFEKVIDLGDATISWDMITNKLYFHLSQFPAITDWPKRVKVIDEAGGVEFGMREFIYDHRGEVQKAIYQTTVHGGFKLWLHVINDVS